MPVHSLHMFTADSIGAYDTGLAIHMAKTMSSQLQDCTQRITSTTYPKVWCSDAITEVPFPIPDITSDGYQNHLLKFGLMPFKDLQTSDDL